MCHNIVEGRLYEGCGHFQAMNTERCDCQTKNCVFSRTHPPSCVHRACNRFMTVPQNRPIRQSPRECPDCAERQRAMGSVASVPVGR
ncbi:hypothetical protein RSOLAG1IB_03781 [Rhizoctonia solani AG-1 IB]|uniref:Uncharacterized protein n=1 Tax=Thanatephorus cucumeris (strain AG1-IB / isolate 7/3/14) TaxID=1108050 RepID=A0A0B7FUI4_THACB|nr:hypothetical protein RSOLAG1IB_03781 [Rhizoctonia solani AG-1 IB]